MDVTSLESLQRLAVALAAGLLIGLERGWQARGLAEGSRVAGFRTFALIGLLGGLTSLLAQVQGPGQGVPVLAAAFLGLGAVVAVGYWRAAARTTDVSATSAIAALVTFGLGAAAGGGELAVAGAGAVIVALLLGTKPQLHHMVERIEQAELLAVLKLLLMSVVLLPVLPDRGLGPWGALNPYRIWWMVVLIAGLSSLGYFAMKLAGPRRGLLLTGVLGGIASSTATTVTLARLARKSQAPERLLASGVLLACSIMFLRILLVAALIAPPLVPTLAAPLLSAGGAALAVALWGAHRGRVAELPREAAAAGAAAQNPFEFGMALKFGLLLAAILVLTEALRRWIGDSGLYLVAAVSGLSDVDAITLTLSALVADGETAPRVASGAILLAAAVNTLVKGTLGTALSGGRLWLWLGGGLGAGLLGGAAALLAFRWAA